MLTTLFIAHSSQLTANPPYKSRLSNDLSEQIEKAASHYLAPNKQEC